MKPSSSARRSSNTSVQAISRRQTRCRRPPSSTPTRRGGGSAPLAVPQTAVAITRRTRQTDNPRCRPQSGPVSSSARRSLGSEPRSPLGAQLSDNKPIGETNPRLLSKPTPCGPDSQFLAKKTSGSWRPPEAAEGPSRCDGCRPRRSSDVGSLLHVRDVVAHVAERDDRVELREGRHAGRALELDARRPAPTLNPVRRVAGLGGTSSVLA